MNKNLSEKIKELFNNSEFVEKMEKTSNPDEMYDLFVDYGIEMSDEEYLEFVKSSLDVTTEKEFDESELDNVSGGALIGILKKGGKALKKTWDWSVGVWGGEKEAVKGITNFWKDVAKGKDPRKRW